MRCKAVVLAAGLGARLAPMTPFIPKEMLPVFGLPAIHHVVYELAEMQVSDVMIVLSEGKECVRHYFSEIVAPKGALAEELSDRRRRLLSRVRVTFAYQRERKGTGDAVLLAKDFAGSDDLIVAYPDDLIVFDGAYGNGSLFTDARERSRDSLLLARCVSGETACNYGVIRSSGNASFRRGSVFRVTSIEEKPAVYRESRAAVLVGRMRLTPECVMEIARHPLTDKYGITTALCSMAKKGSMLAKIADSKVFDVGTHEGYRRLVKGVPSGDLIEVDRYDE